MVSQASHINLYRVVGFVGAHILVGRLFYVCSIYPDFPRWLLLLFGAGYLAYVSAVSLSYWFVAVKQRLDWVALVCSLWFTGLFLLNLRVTGMDVHEVMNLTITVGLVSLVYHDQRTMLLWLATASFLLSAGLLSLPPSQFDPPLLLISVLGLMVVLAVFKIFLIRIEQTRNRFQALTGALFEQTDDALLQVAPTGTAVLRANPRAHDLLHSKRVGDLWPQLARAVADACGFCDVPALQSAVIAGARQRVTLPCVREMGAASGVMWRLAPSTLVAKSA